MNENNEIKRKKLSNCQSNSKILSENNENKEGKNLIGSQWKFKSL
jgi:hypothetical protein